MFFLPPQAGLEGLENRSPDSQCMFSKIREIREIRAKK
jgi:hypothetical protein